jgi:hypothetical protein
MQGRRNTFWLRECLDGLHASSTIHLNGITGQERCFFTGQKSTSIADVLRRGTSAHRYGGDEGLLVFWLAQEQLSPNRLSALPYPIL